MHRTDNLPDGFYLLQNPQEPRVCLVKLYDHPDFKGVRHIAFGPWDGAASMPVWDLLDDSILTPATISVGDTPTNNIDALVPGALMVGRGDAALKAEQHYHTDSALLLSDGLDSEQQETYETQHYMGR